MLRELQLDVGAVSEGVTDGRGVGVDVVNDYVLAAIDNTGGGDPGTGLAGAQGWATGRGHAGDVAAALGGVLAGVVLGDDVAVEVLSHAANVADLEELERLEVEVYVQPGVLGVRGVPEAAGARDGDADVAGELLDYFADGLAELVAAHAGGLGSEVEV